MSAARMGARVALACIAVLASFVFMAAPSWAAKGGNSQASKLCEPGGYPGVLFAQDGSAFKNAGACTKYAAKGGQLVGINVVAGPVENGTYTETCTAFGLKPGSEALCFAEGFGVNARSDVAPDGTWGAVLHNVPCGDTPVASGVTANEAVVTATGTTPACPVPKVLEISPKEGPEAGGTEVTIFGENFYSVSAVYFGTVKAFGVKVDFPFITAVSPPGTPGATVHITVMTPGGTSATSPSDEFTYH